MAKWRLLCKTCPVQVDLAERVTTDKQAQWELSYHLACYRGHDAYVTAQPKPKKRKINGEWESPEEEAGDKDPSGGAI